MTTIFNSLNYMDRDRKGPPTVDYRPDVADIVDKQKKEQGKSPEEPSQSEPAEPNVIVAKIKLARVSAAEAGPEKARQVENISARAKLEAETNARAAYIRRLEDDLKNDHVYAFRLRNVLEGRIKGTRQEEEDIERLESYVQGSKEAGRKGWAVALAVSEATAANIVFGHGEPDQPYVQHKEKLGLVGRLKKLFGREE